MRTARARRVRPVRSIRFGEEGRVGVNVADDLLPLEHRGAVTGANYVWNIRHKSRWVDRRDVLPLVKAVGAEKLTGDKAFDEIVAEIQANAKAKAAAAAKAKQAKEEKRKQQEAAKKAAEAKAAEAKAAEAAKTGGDA